MIRPISCCAETFTICGQVLFSIFRMAPVSRISRSCSVYAADFSFAASMVGMHGVRSIQRGFVMGYVFHNQVFRQVIEHEPVKFFTTATWMGYCGGGIAVFFGTDPPAKHDACADTTNTTQRSGSGYMQYSNPFASRKNGVIGSRKYIGLVPEHFSSLARIPCRRR